MGPSLVLLTDVREACLAALLNHKFVQGLRWVQVELVSTFQTSSMKLLLEDKRRLWCSQCALKTR